MGGLKGGGDSSSWELSEVTEVTVLRLERERLSKLSKLSERLGEFSGRFGGFGGTLGEFWEALATFGGTLGKFWGRLSGRLGGRLSGKSWWGPSQSLSMETLRNFWGFSRLELRRLMVGRPRLGEQRCPLSSGFTNNLISIYGEEIHWTVRPRIPAQERGER